MPGVWLSSLQQEELKRRIIELKRVREQARAGGTADLGFLRIVGDVCTDVVPLTTDQQEELVALIDDLELVLADAAEGREIAMPTALAPRRIVSGIC